MQWLGAYFQVLSVIISKINAILIKCESKFVKYNIKKIQEIVLSRSTRGDANCIAKMWLITYFNLTLFYAFLGSQHIHKSYFYAQPVSEQC